MKAGVAICGGNAGEAWMHWKAYDGCDDARVTGVLCTDAAEAEGRARVWACRRYQDLKELLADSGVSIVEILDPPGARDDGPGRILDGGKHLLLAPPFAPEPGEAAALVERARSAGVLVMSYEPWLFFPPMEKVARLVEKRSVGRVTSIRMRSLIAGRGGWDRFLNPEFTGMVNAEKQAAQETISREIYEKLSLAVKLLGPLEEVFLYADRGDGAAGASVLTWKHRASLSYGALDITCTPAMEIRSAYQPRDDNIEITGSSGIIWLTRASSQLRAEPTVRVYHGENMLSYGHLDDDWLRGYTRCARHFAECVRRRKAPKLDPSEAVYTVKCAEAAAVSADESRRVNIPA